ncbi:FxLYD domain-containing protein [Streptomyces sp. NPDC056227]|uniref:FxLYD domain-containing protein n=1 Tax=Streptomyces sp. NPDC056227 TaxID=3345753 RepID=UPI0035D9D6EC
MSYGYPPPHQQPQQPPPPGQQPPPWGQQAQQPPPWGQQPPYPQWQQPGPGWGGPPRPPKSSNTALIVTLSVLGGLIVMGGIGAVAVVGLSSRPAPRKLPVAEAPPSGETAKADPKEEPAAEADVKLSGCKVDPLTTWPSVNVEIVNGTEETANYVVNVEFVDGDGTRVAEGLAVASDLASGQRAKAKAQGLGKSPAGTKCKVTKVTRYSSGG